MFSNESSAVILMFSGIYVFISLYNKWFGIAYGICAVCYSILLALGILPIWGSLAMIVVITFLMIMIFVDYRRLSKAIRED